MRSCRYVVSNIVVIYRTDVVESKIEVGGSLNDGIGLEFCIYSVSPFHFEAYFIHHFSTSWHVLPQIYWKLRLGFVRLSKFLLSWISLG
jgi:hypothetical protein